MEPGFGIIPFILFENIGMKISNYIIIQVDN